MKPYCTAKLKLTDKTHTPVSHATQFVIDLVTGAPKPRRVESRDLLFYAFAHLVDEQDQPPRRLEDLRGGVEVGAERIVEAPRPQRHDDVGGLATDAAEVGRRRVHEPDVGGRHAVAARMSRAQLRLV